ncbi:MAG: glycosyltransferase [Treponemataceae bacterium]
MISVVIPTYNKAGYINKTIESVLNQTYKDWEIVIVDDCSKDNTEEVVQKYLSDKIRYYKHKTNIGPGANFNYGIEKARSEYVTIIASDDVLLPNHLEKVMEEFGDDEVETVFPILHTIDETGKLTEKEAGNKSIDKYLLLNRLFYIRNVLPSPGISFKKTLFKKTPPFNPSLIMTHDYDLNVRALMHGKASIVSEPTVLYRRFSDPLINLSGNTGWVRVCEKVETNKVLDNFLNLEYDDMKKVFPQLVNCTAEDIKFRLLVDTCKYGDERLKSWGLERLIDFLEKNEGFFKGNRFDFQFKDYINLYKLNKVVVVGTTHKQRLFTCIKNIIKRLFGLR